MVVHPQVAGDISLTLKNVTISEVMDAVRDVYGYEYQRSANGFQVMPIHMQSRVFEIDYLDVKRTSNQKPVSTRDRSLTPGITVTTTTIARTTATVAAITQPGRAARWLPNPIQLLGRPEGATRHTDRHRRGPQRGGQPPGRIAVVRALPSEFA